MTEHAASHNYTRNILLQMAVVLLLVGSVTAWQWDVVRQIYVANQVNAVGWVVNGGILLLFTCGLVELVRRFLEYRTQEQSINRFKANVANSEEPLLGIDQGHMVAQRFLTLKSLSRRKASINHNALAATLLASESSRNSFLKFVHNVLILTGVFGTIISLSIALLGASDILQGGPVIAADDEGANQAGGLGTMIFGMSTALSTTLTAIIAYLFFGYFYIKLTDTQTFLISKVEEVTATTLLPHLQPDQEAVVRDYSESIQAAGELVRKLDRSQQSYADSAEALQDAARELAGQLARSAERPDELGEIARLMREMMDIQQRVIRENADNTQSVVRLLRRGFRLRDDG